MTVDIIAPQEAITSETVRSIPQPQHFLVEDINVTDSGEVGHQHIDFIFYGAAPTEDIQPGPGEQPADDWTWFTVAELHARSDEIPSDVVEIGRRAIEAVGSR